MYPYQDIDSELDALDLVETEDGFLPAAALPAREESGSSKRTVTIPSPRRPSSLNLAGQQARPGRGSCSSASSRASATDTPTPCQPARAAATPPAPTPGRTGGRRGSGTSSDYPELSSLPSSLASPTNTQLNDPGEVLATLQLDRREQMESQIAGVSAITHH